MSSSAHRTTQPSVKPTRRRWASINDIAEHLDVTERTVRQMIADGRLTGYRLSPKFIRLDLDEVDAAMVPFGGGVVGMSAHDEPVTDQVARDRLEDLQLGDVLERAQEFALEHVFELEGVLMHPPDEGRPGDPKTNRATNLNTTTAGSPAQEPGPSLILAGGSVRR